MPIKVSCNCGQSFTAKDDLEGQTLLCPKCHQPLTIGADQQAVKKKSSGGMADLFDEAGIEAQSGPICPGCRKPMAADAMICVQCGYNKETGESIQGAKIRTIESGGHQEAADSLLDRAKQQIAEDKAELKKSTKQGTPAWIYFILLAILVAFVGMMFTLPRNQAFYYSGVMFIVFGWLICQIFVIMVWIVAFKETLAQGLMSMLIPLYVLVYIFMRWNACKAYFMKCLGGGLVILFGFGLTAVSHVVGSGRPGDDDEKESRRWQKSLSRPAIVRLESPADRPRLELTHKTWRS